MIMDETDHDEANFIGYGFGGDPDRTETFIFFPFACPNFGCFYHRYPPPARVTIQLAGLAEKATTFDSVEEFEMHKEMERQQEEEDVLFSSENFVANYLYYLIIPPRQQLHIFSSLIF